MRKMTLCLALGAAAAWAVLPLNQWTYIQIDNGRQDTKAFGLGFGDVNRDGYQDVFSGKYFYRNPGGNMASAWPRTVLRSMADAKLFVDVDGDALGDIIGNDNGTILWMEADNVNGSSWTSRIISTIEDCRHLGGQGYEVAEIYGGGKPEIIINGGEYAYDRYNMYYFMIPTSNPEAGNWTKKKITGDATGDGLAAVDLDGDGRLDIASGHYDANSIKWWKNPGNNAENWQKLHVNDFPRNGGWSDVVRAADLDGDGDKDIVVCREGPGAVFWYENGNGWASHTVIEQSNSINAMDVADMDQDGDVDIITGDHSGTGRKLVIHANNGAGSAWIRTTVDNTNKEHHCGARVADLDNDGDLDIVSFGYFEYQYLHLWRNNAVTGSAVHQGPVKKADPAVTFAQSEHRLRIHAPGRKVRTVEMFNIQGRRLLLRQTNGADALEIPLTGLQGFLLVRLAGENEMFFRKMMILR